MNPHRYLRSCGIEKRSLCFKVLDISLKGINLRIQGLPSSLQNINCLFRSSLCIIPFSQKNLTTKTKQNLLPLRKRRFNQGIERGRHVPGTHWYESNDQGRTLLCQTEPKNPIILKRFSKRKT